MEGDETAVRAAGVDEMRATSMRWLRRHESLFVFTIFVGLWAVAGLGWVLWGLGFRLDDVEEKRKGAAK